MVALTRSALSKATFEDRQACCARLETAAPAPPSSAPSQSGDPEGPVFLVPFTPPNLTSSAVIWSRYRYLRELLLAVYNCSLRPARCDRNPGPRVCQARNTTTPRKEKKKGG